MAWFLSRNSHGFVTLQLPAGKDGELMDYRMAPTSAGGLELDNLANGEHYAVTPRPDEPWHCDCPFWRHRGSKGARRGCKHTRALEELYAVLLDFRSFIAPYLESPLMSEPNPEIEALVSALSEPFDPREVKFKPSVVSGNRALALAYVDARVIQDRLDAVLGVAGWQDHYECLQDGNVVCKLSLHLGEQWITKMDVGGQSEQKDEGDRLKAAFSDALKRAAVKFGIGRYLYRIPSQWVDYDPQKKQFRVTPTLPAAALPAKKAAAPASQAPAKPAAERPPADAAELEMRLKARDEAAVKAGLLKSGDVFRHAVEYARAECGCTSEIVNWPRLVQEAVWKEIDRWAAQLVAAKKKPA